MFPIFDHGFGLMISLSLILTSSLSFTSTSLQSKRGVKIWRGCSSRASFPLYAVSTSNEKSSETGNIEFPEELTGSERLVRAATFWSSAVPIVASYYGKMTELKIRQDLLGECLSEDECEIIWNEQHLLGAEKIAGTITELKGFYAKTAQIIASRQDLFPPQYVDALSGFTDSLDPMPVSIVKGVIKAELLNKGETFEDIFIEFDDEPLGSATVAQVHRAVLSEKYGGPREVAVKVQRPAIESKLMGDIANLIAISKPLQEAEALPLDYYTVFCELEKQLGDEFDFVAEAVAMDRIYTALTRSSDGSSVVDAPVTIPRPVTDLVCKRVLVMDYLKGVPLSRAQKEMERRGIDPESAEARLFGKKLLKGLTEVFGRSILETGFFHADPHPGNIFVLDDGSIGLIDFGQVKQISGRSKETLAKVMVALDSRESDTNPSDLKKIGDLALELGVKFKPDVKAEAPAAVAMWLFDGSVKDLPGGKTNCVYFPIQLIVNVLVENISVCKTTSTFKSFSPLLIPVSLSPATPAFYIRKGYDKGELSPNSPVRDLKSFPQDLVLVGRSSILIKGLSDRLNIPWSLASEWAPIAKEVLSLSSKSRSVQKSDGGVRFRDVVGTSKQWIKRKITNGATKLPSPIRKRVASTVLKIQERRERKKSPKP